MKYRNCKTKEKMAVLQDASLRKKKYFCNKKVRVCLITFFQWQKKKNLIMRWNSEKKIRIACKLQQRVYLRLQDINLQLHFEFN